MDLKNVFNFLKQNKVSSKDAKKLGIQLDIPKSIIDKICSDNNGDSDNTLTEIIEYWQNNKDVSWINLSKALEKCDHVNLARFIRKKTQCESEL